jgi:uncharacterized membrane protein
MTTRPLPRPAASGFRAKHVAFAFIFAMMAYVINHNERFLIDARDEAWKHYETFKWWLLPHGTAAACALLLGPMQFSDRLRRRYIKLHRVLGWIYVCGALIGAPLGTYIQYRFDERLGDSRGFTIATVVDAFLWMSTTTIALIFARRGKIQQHRQWMTRSYAVAIVFLEVRFISGVGGWDSSGPAATETIIWVCIALALLWADIANQWQDLWPARAVTAKSMAPARMSEGVS